MNQITLAFKAITKDSSDQIAILTLNRPKTANAFNHQMIAEITDAIKSAEKNKTCRALIIQAQGKHFSAGADLGWMKSSAELSYEDNLEGAQHLTKMFESLYNFPRPTIALIQGAAFGGAVGLICACDIAIAEDTAKFCLSEVKLGILPAVIFPYLGKKISARSLRWMSLTGCVLRGPMAEKIGLITRSIPSGELLQEGKKELNYILQASPLAQAQVKKLLSFLENHSFQQGPQSAEAIANARASEEAQHGFSSFFSKTPPRWNQTLDEGFKLNANEDTN